MSTWFPRTREDGAHYLQRPAVVPMEWCIFRDAQVRFMLLQGN
jgi:hypothetical protein